MKIRTIHISVFCTLIFAVLFGFVSVTRAGSVQWTGWQFADYSGYQGGGCLSDDGGCLLTQNTVLYSANAVNAGTGASVCGASVPADSTVNFTFADQVPSDFSWFISGYADDSPYGQWSSTVPDLSSAIAALGASGPYGLPTSAAYFTGTGAGPSGVYTPTVGGYTQYYHLSNFSDANAQYSAYAKPPARSVSGIQDLFDCGSPDAKGSVQCTPKHPGSATAVFNFAATQAAFLPASVAVWGYTSWVGSAAEFMANPDPAYQVYVEYWNWYNTNYPQYIAQLGPLQTKPQFIASQFQMPYTVPAQTISCPITVTPPANRPPGKPTVETSSQCTVGQDFSIGMTGTDPDGDRLYYQVYWLWDTDKTAYERIPASGTVASGQLVAATHRYATSGSHSVAVKAVDTGGNVSQASQQLSFNCASAPPPPTVTIRADAPSIQIGQSTGIHATFAIGTGDTMTNTALNEVPPAAAEFTIPGYGYNPVLRYDYVFTPATTGTYVFKPYTITAYYNSWNSWGQSATVTVTPPACVDRFYCSGVDQRHVDVNCTDTFRQRCPYQCADGRCILPPTPTFNPNGHLRVSPALVRSGDTTKVYWDVSNVSTCTVTGDNPLHDTWTILGTLANSWTSTAGATGKTSTAITQRTTFTLSCIGLDNSTVSDSATVNILPVFEEQ